MAKLNIKFVDEMGNNLNRYKAIDVNTGAEYVFDLSRNGTITTVGTPLNAEIMNAIVEAINNIDLENNIIEQKVLCPDRYEFTGDTGDEHGLAIEDQQMLLDKIQGRTLVKNQLVNKNSLPSDWVQNGITFSNKGDGSFVLNGTATASMVSSLNNYISPKYNHIYACLGLSDQVNSYAKSILLSCNDSNGSWAGEYSFYKGLEIRKIDRPTIVSGGLYLNIGTNQSYLNANFKLQLIDLTLMYGAGNEPTNIQQVLSDFPEYMEYNEGSFIHSKNNLISTGRNLLNVNFKEYTNNIYVQDTPPIKVLKNTTYTMQIFGDLSKYDKMYAKGVNTGNTIFMANVKDYNGIASFNTEEDSEIVLQVNNFTPTTNNQTIPILNNNVMLIYGDEKNALQQYEPYEEDVMVVNQELKAFDYIDNIGNNIKNYTKSKIISSNEIVSVTNDYNNITYYSFPKPNDYIGKGNINGGFICDKFPFNVEFSNWDDSNKIGQIFRGADYDYFWVGFPKDTTLQEAQAKLNGAELLYESNTPIITPLQLPRGYAVAKGGMQIQQGTIPYLLTKTYSLSLAAQVKANIQIDKEQQAQIDGLSDLIKENSENINSNEIRVSNIENEVDKINGELISYNDKIGDHTIRIENLENRINNSGEFEPNNLKIEQDLIQTVLKYNGVVIDKIDSIDLQYTPDIDFKIRQTEQYTYAEDITINNQSDMDMYISINGKAEHKDIYVGANSSFVSTQYFESYDDPYNSTYTATIEIKIHFNSREINGNSQIIFDNVKIINLVAYVTPIL